MSEREIKGYHAHIYYDPATKGAAARVREGLGAGFRVQLGSWHDEPVGPHLKAMYQAVFVPEEFGKIVPWLMIHREGLSVLVHPSTGDGYEDHLERSLWLGEKLKLNENVLSRSTSRPGTRLSSLDMLGNTSSSGPTWPAARSRMISR